MDNNRLLAELKRDEGYNSYPYQCTANKTTIGYGHNIQDNGISFAAAEFILKEDIEIAINDCERLPWFEGLSDNRKRVIVNMIFNMGLSTFMKFEKMINRIEMRDYEGAGNEMRDSRWHRQCTLRAERLIKIMQEG